MRSLPRHHTPRRETRRDPVHCRVAVRQYRRRPGATYFVDGVTESLTTDLSRIGGAFVIARNTAFVHATFTRDHEYKRLETVSLLAGIDLVTGQVHALVKDRHRSRKFVPSATTQSTPASPHPHR
jgi:TolB-like protein